MADELQRIYDVTMTVLSPVHIGTGEMLPSMEYVQEGQRIYVLDAEALVQQLAASPSRLKAFQYLGGKGAMGLFLREQGLSPSKLALYSLPLWGSAPQEGIENIWPFIKVAGRPPMPYIPGSSLKGALRTALLRHHVWSLDQEDREALVKQALKQGPKRADDPFEKAFFGPSPHTDWLRTIELEDTLPLSLKYLAVAQVKTLALKGQEGFPLSEKFVSYPEVLLPSGRGRVVRLHTRLRLAQRFFQPRWACQAGFRAERVEQLEELVEICNQVARKEIERELAFARQVGWQEMERFYKKLFRVLRQVIQRGELHCLLRLGWGTGFGNKTINPELEDELYEKLKARYFSRLGAPSLPRALSPKTRRVVVPQEGKLVYPLGWVRLHFEEVRR
ncbi:MAG: type III-A CRISPR-associated RAMP protein Csm5 [Anaerolineae bacterium]|nr:type III-A CRISPR-associated RAMP protein Csm5 [Anaerolineae bacterium]